MASVQFTSATITSYFNTSLASKKSTGKMENLTNTVLGNTSSDISAIYKDSSDIRNGSYYKLLKAYYAEQKKAEKTTKNETDSKNQTDMKSEKTTSSAKTAAVYNNGGAYVAKSSSPETFNSMV